MAYRKDVLGRPILISPINGSRRDWKIYHKRKQMDDIYGPFTHIPDDKADEDDNRKSDSGWITEGLRGLPPMK